MSDNQTVQVPMSLAPDHGVPIDRLSFPSNLNFIFKDTIPIFRAEFGDFSKWPRDGYNEVNDILAYGV